MTSGQLSANGPIVSVVLPTFNECENILPLIRLLSKELEHISHEIIVVDDNSPDETWRLVSEESERNSSIHLIRRTHERGYRSALSAGIASSIGRVIVFMDSDFQHPPRLVPLLLQEIQKGEDIAIGSRFIGGKQRDRRLGVGGEKVPLVVSVHGRLSLLLSRVLSVINSHNVSDWTSGLIAVRREVFDDYRLHGHYGECFISLVAHCLNKKLTIAEVPYMLDLRRDGTSKTSGYGWTRLIGLGLLYMVVVFRCVWQRWREDTGEINS